MKANLPTLKLFGSIFCKLYVSSGNGNGLLEWEAKWESLAEKHGIGWDRSKLVSQTFRGHPSPENTTALLLLPWVCVTKHILPT